MSVELIAILATVAFQSGLIIVSLVMLYRQGKQLGINDNAIFLQDRRVTDTLKAVQQEMRELISQGHPNS